MALRLSRTVVEELNENKRAKQVELAQAVNSLGGRDTALTPNYAQAKPTVQASIPVLKNELIAQYEANQQNVNPITNALTFRGDSAYNAQQAATPLYNQVKTEKVQSVLDRLGQEDIARGRSEAVTNDLKNISNGTFNTYDNSGDIVSRLTNTLAQEVKTNPTLNGALFGGVVNNNAVNAWANQATGSRLTPEMQALGLTENDLRIWNQAKNEEERQAVLSRWAEEHPVLATLDAIPENAIGSVSNVLKQLGSYATGRALTEKPTNADIYRGTVAGNIDSKLGQFAYSGVNSLADMLFATLLASPAGAGANAASRVGRTAAAIMGAEKGNEVMNSAIERGLTPNQIMAEGVGSGVSTALTEALPLERMLGGGSHILTSMLSEGGQEVLEDLVDTAIDELVTRAGGNGDRSELHQNYNAYLGAGYNADEAFKNMALDYLKQLGADFALGGITGGIMGGGANLIQGNNVITGSPRRTENTSNVAVRPESNSNESLIPILNEIIDRSESTVPEVEQIQTNPEPIQTNPEPIIPEVETPEVMNPVVDTRPSEIEAAENRSRQITENFIRELETGNVINPMNGYADVLADLTEIGQNYPELRSTLNEELRRVNRAMPSQPINPVSEQNIPSVEPIQETPLEVVPETIPTLSRNELSDLQRQYETYSDKLSNYNTKNAKVLKKRLEKAYNTILNAEAEAQTQAVNDFNNTIKGIDNVMSGETVDISARENNRELYQDMKRVTDNYKVRVTQDMINQLGLKNVTELNNNTNTGAGRIKFVLKGGTPIDSVYPEMYDLAHGTLPSPENMAEGDLLKALYNYIREPKSGSQETAHSVSWENLPILDNRSVPEIRAEVLRNDMFDKIERNLADTESWEKFLSEASDLARKYPQIKDSLYQMVSEVDDYYRSGPQLNLDEDVQQIENVDEGVDKLIEEASMLPINLNMFGGDVDEDTDVDTVERGRVKTGRMRTSDVYSNTGKRSGFLDPEQAAMHEADGSMLMESNSERESVNEAHRRLEENGYVNEYKELMKLDKFDNVDVDEAMMIWRDLFSKIQSLKERGLDYSKEKQQAYNIFVKIKNIESNNASALQALAKWSRNNTAEGLLSQATQIIKTARRGQNQWFRKVRNETKGKTDFMDADFMIRFLEEAKKLDDFTSKSLADRLEQFGQTNFANVLRNVYAKVQNAQGTKERADAMTDYQNLYRGILNRMEKVNPEVNGVSWNDSSVPTYMDAREAKHIMANLGKLVNTQIPYTLREKITTLLMDNMLGNFRTLITRNAGGNIGFNLVEEFARKPLASLIDAAASKRTGIRTVGGLSREGIKAGWEGFKDGVKQEIYDWQNDINSARSGENEGESNLKTATGNNRNALTSKIGKLYNKAVKFGLSIGDRPFYEFVYRQSMVEYERLYKEGKLGDMTRSEFDEIAKAYAQLNALQAVYQDDSKMALGFIKIKQGIAEMSEGITGADLLSQFTMPFVKTPANIIERAIEYSPVGIIKNAVQTIRDIRSRDPEFDSRQAQMRFVNETARNIIGSALFMGAMAMAKSGALTGGYSDDKDMRQAQKEAGMQEYALHNPLGSNMDIDISWIPVLGNNMVAAAAAYEAGSNPNLTPLESLAEGATAGLKSQFDSSMLQGLQRLVGGSGSFGNDSGNVVSNAKDTLLSGMTQFIPSLLRQGAAVADPYRRQLSGVEDKDYYFNSVLNSIPGLRQNLEPRISRTGEEMEQNPGRSTLGKIFDNFINPATVTMGTPDAVRDEAMRLFEATQDNRAFEPTVTMSELKVDGHIPTPEEYTEYQRAAYGAMNEAATQLINSEAYENMSEEERINTLARLYSSIKTVEKKNVLDLDKDNLDGPEKAYDEDGIDGLIDYLMGANVLSQLGLNNDAKYRESALELLDEHGAAEIPEIAEEYQDAINDATRSVRDYMHTNSVIFSGLTKEQKETLENDIYNAVRSVETKNLLGLDISNLSGAEKAYYEGGIEGLSTYVLAKTTLNQMGLQNNSNNREMIINTLNEDGADKVQQMISDSQALSDAGFSDNMTFRYNHATQYIPSLAPQEFYDLFKEIDTDDPEKESIKQSELLAYFNNNNVSEEDAMNYWLAFGPSDPWAKIPTLNSDGVYVAKKP